MSNLKKVDPISLLRESFIENKPIRIDKNILIFHDKTALKLDTPTAWQPPDKTKRYTLGDLWLFLSIKLEKKPVAEYYSKISSFKPIYNFQMISFIHQGCIKRRNRTLLFRENQFFRMHRTVSTGNSNRRKNPRRQNSPRGIQESS